MGHRLRSRLNAAVLVVAALLQACNLAPNSAGQISGRIGEVTARPDSRVLDLPRLTSFGWDRLHLFPPGTARPEICRWLGADRHHCERVIRYEAVPADHVAMMFTLRGQLTHTELHALAHGVFDFAPPPDGLPRDRAVFDLRREVATPQGPRTLLTLR